MRHFGYKRRRMPFKGKNAVIHVPSTIGGTIATGAEALLVLQSPSIFAAGSASSNIEAQDKDRTVNVGHHMGQCTIDFTARITTADGALEFLVMQVQRSDATPAINNHPVPSAAQMASQGLQQACRMANPGRVVHFSVRAYSADNTIAHKIVFRPGKFKVSKVKAGDHWILIVHNRGSATVTYDMQARYKEYE